MKNLTFLITLISTLYLSLNAQTAFDFQTAQDLQGFTVTGQINANDNISFGSEGMTITWDGPDADNGAPNGRKPQLRHIDANVDASTEKILALTINNTSNGAVDRFRIIHIKGNNPDVATQDVNSFSGALNRYAGFDIEGSTDGFKTFYFDLQNPAWANYTNDSETDDVANGVEDFDHFRLQFLKDSGSNPNDWVTQAGSLTIQKIEFISEIPATERYDYTFDADTEGFVGQNYVSLSQPVAGQLNLDIAATSPYPKLTQSGTYYVNADLYKYVTVYVSENNSPKSRMTFVSPQGGNQFIAADMISNSTEEQVLQYDLSTTSNWTGNINNFAFQFLEPTTSSPVPSAGTLIIDRILFSTTNAFEQNELPAYVPTEGLVGYWPFNGNANDASGNGNNGTVNGATLITDQYGNPNSAYSFDGVNDFIQAPNYSSNSSFTVSCWVNMTTYSLNSLGANDMIFVLNHSGENNLSRNFMIGYRNFGNEQGMSSYIYDNTGVSGGYLAYLTNQTPPSVNEWHHMVSVFENGTYVKMYLDGELININTENIPTQTNMPSLPIFFGKGVTQQVNYLQGKLDDIGFWNRALTQEEINNLFNSEISSSPYEWINYGTQDWTVENAEMVTYRDGTPIPQVTDATEWSNLTTGAWCYYDNDPTKGKLYNWYAVAGIHDNDPNTPNKELAPEGWHVPSDEEWTTLENYLIANGYNYDQTTTEDKIAKSMASTTGWSSSNVTGAIGNDQSLNNNSGFNAFPEGIRYHISGHFGNEGDNAMFWSSAEYNINRAWRRNLSSSNSYLARTGDGDGKQNGFSVRFVRNNNDCIVVSAPTGDAQQSFDAAATVADLVATGDNLQWYDAATDGNLLDSSAALTNGQVVYASQTLDGCESTDRLEVTVVISTVEITASATEVCAGESVDLLLNYNLEISNDYSLLGDFEGSSYYISSEPVTFSVASTFNSDHNVSFLTITSQGENNFISSNSLPGKLWLGCNDLESEGDWVWFNNEDFTYSNWDNGEPNNQVGGEDYGEFRTSGYWNDIPSDVLLYHVFESSVSILWSTGETTESISVSPTETTEYWVDVTTNGVTSRDTITITVNPTGTCPSSTYEWINYGTQDWTVENAEMVTYRDGTPIPQVTDATEWSNLTTGAWSYYNNDPTKPRLYNWYAVMGIHDTDPNTPNKEFAPQGWHIPSDEEWTTLENYLIANGYNYDSTTTGNKIAKSMASTTGWNSSTTTGAIGNDQSLNNSSGFNAFPEGYRHYYGSFGNEGDNAIFWSSTEYNANDSWYRNLYISWSFLKRASHGPTKRYGFSVRFVRDATSLSTTDFSNSIIIYPNPVKNMLTIDGLVVKDVVIYSVLGKVVLKISNQNTIDVSSLSKGVYFIKVSDGINTSTKKFIKE